MNRLGETVCIRSAAELTAVRPAEDGALALVIPSHWKPASEVNVHAAPVEEATLAWFHGFGELAMERSPAWIETVIGAMAAWSSAALS
ncbi:hypothetical protein [Polyangium sp. 15x6]|uniref:hypothetical protein n=1 Tax=Polyangium sp. 15x6 TaxID=3042687 RepID=UPI00249A3065|nr:hypothetical protein [Polyangium sp. 15x6]MDI3286827.1 hypothetical protein [Polyangium sp. 15x6]